MAGTAGNAYLDRTLEREGVSLRLRLEPLEGPATAPRAGDIVRLSVELERLADGQPLSNLPIGAWLDREVSVMSGAMPACGQRIASILGGGLLQRPLLDLAGYYVLTLDAEGSLSVLDPAVSFAGRSSLYTAVQLGGVPFDWARTADDRWIFVALPEQRQVVAIDLQTFAVRQRIDVGGRPTRLALQPDGQLLWVAQRADGEDSDGERVDLFTVSDGHHAGGAALAPGHHEIAFSDDGRYGYVTSRDAGTLAVIDSAGGTRVREVELGGQPLSVLSLPSRGQVWVVDGEHGVVHRLTRDGAQIDRIRLAPGLGPARLAPDGRHVLVVNPAQHRLDVLTADDGRLRHSLTVSGRPYDIFFSERYAYVRPLDIEQVAMFALSGLETEPVLQYIPVGEQAVGAFPGLPVASTMSDNMERMGAFFAAPGERTVYHYMEGMNAPDSGIRTYGHTPIAVTISQRGLRETGRGRYSTTFRLPSQGRMVLALASESPRLRECIAWNVAPGAEPAQAAAWSVQWIGEPAASVRAGDPVEFVVRVQGTPGLPPPDARQLAAWVVPGGGGRAEHWPLRPTGRSGEYRIVGALGAPGGYFVHVRGADSGSRSLSALPASLVVE